MRVNIAVMGIMLMTAALLTGCMDTKSVTVNESDVYMSQFGNYEIIEEGTDNDESVQNDVKDKDALSATTSGEKVFEETKSDGKPVKKESDKDKKTANIDQDVAENENDEAVDSKKNTSAPKKKATKAAEPVPVADPATQLLIDPALNPQLLQPLVLPDAGGLYAQSTWNPTQNYSSDSSGGSSDTGSGVSQTCDDSSDSESDNSSSSNNASADFE